MTSSLHYRKYLKPYAQKLRREMTDAERKLWYHLRQNTIDGLRFNRQVPIGNFIVDFLCRKKKLIIELDGSQHEDDEQKRKDIARDATLNNLGYAVLRFNDHDALINTGGVIEQIISHIRQASPINPYRSP